jgi:hypothetical protein
MIPIPTIDELRETRRRLAEQAGLDIQRYAALLQGAAGQQRPGTYVAAPLLPQPTPSRVPDPVSPTAEV